MGGDALPVLPPLEVLTARRRLCSKFPVERPVEGCGTDRRSSSALRFKGFTVDAGLETPLVWAGGFAAPGALAPALFVRESWEMSGEDEDELEELFWLSERLRPGTSEALVGGEEPSGDGFWGEVEGREEGRLEVVFLADGWDGSSFGVGASALGTLGVGAGGVSVDRALAVDLAGACLAGGLAGAGAGAASGISSSSSSDS